MSQDFGLNDENENKEEGFKVILDAEGN